MGKRTKCAKCGATLIEGSCPEHGVSGQTAKSHPCQATRNFEPSCGELAVEGARFCAKHRYIDGSEPPPYKPAVLS